MPALDHLTRTPTRKSAKYDAKWLVDLDMGPHPLWLLEDLAADLDLRPGMRVLDLGSGLGATSVFLAREYGVRRRGRRPVGRPERGRRGLPQGGRRRPGPADAGRRARAALRPRLVRRHRQHRRVGVLRHRRPLPALPRDVPQARRPARGRDARPDDRGARARRDPRAHRPRRRRRVGRVAHRRVAAQPVGVQPGLRRPSRRATRPDACANWLLWERAVMELKGQPTSPVQQMLEADGGAFVTFALVTGRVA